MARLDSFTLLISGPVGSRIEDLILTKRLRMLEQIAVRSKMSIVISTYCGEHIPKLSLQNFCQIQIPDPGADELIKADSLIVRNTTRLFASTIAGLLEVKTDYVIKTRIEVLPSDDIFESTIDSVLKLFQAAPEKLIVCEAMHYRSLYKNSKGTFLFIPDTFQIMRSSQMLELWQSAQFYWKTFRSSWMLHRKQISNEQILGLAFAKMTNQEFDNEFIENFPQIKINRRVFQVQQDFERHRIQTLSSKSLNFFPTRITTKNTPHRILSDTVSIPNSNKKNSSYLIFRLQHQLFYWFFRIRHISLFMQSARSKNKFLTKVYWRQFLH